MEVGPLRLVPGGNGQLREVEGAWNEYTNLLFIDQPAGTGYSYVNTNHYLHELPEMAAQVVEFLKNWYKVFPEYSHQDTYLGGESYAGQYIPYIADAILKTTVLPTRLSGLLIGNGWVDPYHQYPAYLEFAVAAGVVKKGSDTESKIKEQVKSCDDALVRGGLANVRVHNNACEGILGAITDSTVQSVNGQNMCVNNYDVRLTDTHPACGMNWPPDLADITPYLQRADVKTAFHANRHPGGWVECNGMVGANFWAIKSRPSVFLLPDLLEKVPILFFAGDQDLICNHVGIERMIENLEWNGSTGFGNISAQDWHVDGKRAGTWTTSRNLTYVKVSDASHMVPYDQPLASHDMLVRFLNIDLLGAAGPAAQVPSRVGNEQEAVLGETHLNGTAVLGTSPSSSSTLVDSAGGKLGLPTDALANESAVEALVNAGSAMVIILLMLLAGAVFFCLRKRVKRSIFGSGAASRRQSSGRRPGRDEEEANELEELVEREERGGSYRDDAKGKGRDLDRERVFSLGEGEEEEDERSS